MEFDSEINMGMNCYNTGIDLSVHQSFLTFSSHIVAPPGHIGIFLGGFLSKKGLFSVDPTS